MQITFNDLLHLKEAYLNKIQKIDNDLANTEVSNLSPSYLDELKHYGVELEEERLLRESRTEEWGYCEEDYHNGDIHHYTIMAKDYDDAVSQLRGDTYVDLDTLERIR